MGVSVGNAVNSLESLAVGTLVGNCGAFVGVRVGKPKSAFWDGREVGDPETVTSAASDGLGVGVKCDAEGKPRNPRTADGEGLCSTKLGKGDDAALDEGADDDPARNEGAYDGPYDGARDDGARDDGEYENKVGSGMLGGNRRSVLG